MKNKAFTIVELLVVIAIIWILFMAAMNFDITSKSDTSKRDRIISYISNIIKTEEYNSLMWRWYLSWSALQVADYSQIVINSGSVYTLYYVWNTTKTGSVFSYPFFGEKNYYLKDFVYQSKTWSTWSLTLPFSLVLKNWNITFSWSDATQSDAIAIKFAAWFNRFYKDLILDRRSWKVEIK